VSGLEGPGLVAGGLALLGLAVVVRKRRDDGIDHVNRRAKSVPDGIPIKGRAGLRSLESIDGITIHQTGVGSGFGITAQQLARAGGSRRRALEERAKRTPYHVFYSPRERVSFGQWDPARYTFHGHGLNARTIGWAYDGNVQKVGEPLDVDGAQASLRATIRYLKDRGVPIKYLFAHRQSSADRGGDPGARFWFEVVIPVAESEGLEPLQVVYGSGKTIPDSWRVKS
jgi:hypothetical protein